MTPEKLAWAVRVSADVADRRMRDQGRTEWNDGDRLLAELVCKMLTRGDVSPS